MRRSWTLAAGAAVVGAAVVAVALGSAGPAPASSGLLPDVIDGARGRGAHVVAVGDVAYPGGPYAQTARVTAALAPRRVLVAGDLAYNSGSPSEFAAYFDPDWGTFRDILMAVPGNHEYRTPLAAGYRQYVGDSGGLWWTRRVGAWRVIGLDSERVSSRKQRRFLRRTLARYDGIPTLVMWHRPRYSRGSHSDQPDTARLWRVASSDADVKVVVWGHDHDYERMAVPVSSRPGVLPAFVVGTGGAGLRCDTSNDDRAWSEFFDCTTHGVLDLRLRKRSFSWAYVTTEGQVLDRGTHRW